MSSDRERMLDDWCRANSEPEVTNITRADLRVALLLGMLIGLAYNLVIQGMYYLWTTISGN